MTVKDLEETLQLGGDQDIRLVAYLDDIEGRSGAAGLQEWVKAALVDRMANEVMRERFTQLRERLNEKSGITGGAGAVVGSG